MKHLKKLLLIPLFFFILSPANATLIDAAKVKELNNNVEKVASSSEYDTSKTLEDEIAVVVRIILSVLGSIFILLTFLAGNDWVQAAGNEEKVRKSKDTIRNLAIGLALVLIAYALSSGFSKLVSTLLLTK